VNHCAWEAQNRKQIDWQAAMSYEAKIGPGSTVNNVEVGTLETLFMKLTSQAPLSTTDQEAALLSVRQKHSFYQQKLKRLFDLLVCMLLLPVAGPLMALAAVAIKVTSPGPVFYRQRRVGQDGQQFVLWKLRTMHQAAEEKTGPVWASESDPRVTPVGQLLRKTKIDELPQLVNVLKGEMSLVGPRPERPEFVRQFSQMMLMYSHRHAVRPGITGWAQVNRGYDTAETDVFRKLRYDLYYVHNISLGLDLLIIARTVFILLGVSKTH